MGIERLNTYSRLPHGAYEACIIVDGGCYPPNAPCVVTDLECNWNGDYPCVTSDTCGIAIDSAGCIKTDAELCDGG